VPVAERENDVWLRWTEHGDPDGAPLLLIMGLAGSSRAWWRLLPALEADGHRVITFDNRGTGESSRVRGFLSMADMVGDALAVMDDARVADAHVVGVSMGGMIAQHLALDHPQRVRSLLLGCTTPQGRSGAPSWRMMAATALRPALGPRRTFEIVAPALYAEGTRRDHPERILEDLRIRGADATPGATIIGQMAAISGHDTRARLGELGGRPVTVVHGEADALVSPQRGRELAAGIPGAELVTIPGCGHMLTTDAEEASVGAIRTHLRGAVAPAPAAA
jgi:pimeloyl-ACP methyl ester carboxylesterase